jgi:hypothetical protein
MVMGDAFPQDQQLAYFLECFTPGYIFYLHCSFAKPPKSKYLLLACVEPKPLFFIINSTIHNFYQIRPHLKACQVQISCASHSFLDHDSFIDCTNVILDFDKASVQQQVLASMTRIKGLIDSQCKAAVITAVTQSLSLEHRYKNMILTALTGH